MIAREGALGPGGTSSGNLYNLAGFLAEPPLTRTVPANKRASRELLIAIANARQYGNGALVAPPARLDDGLLDVVMVGHRSALRGLCREQGRHGPR